MVGLAVRADELLGKLGTSADPISAQIGALSNGSLEKLKKLDQRLAMPNARLAGFMDAANRRSEIPVFGYNPKPETRMLQLKRFLGRTYHRDLIPKHESARSPLQALLDPETSRAAQLTRLIFRRGSARRALESSAQGKVVMDYRSDGSLAFIPFTAQEKRLEHDPVKPEVAFAVLRGMSSSELNQQVGVGAGVGHAVLGMQQIDPILGEIDSIIINEGRKIAHAQANGASKETLDTMVLTIKRMMDKRSHAMDLYKSTLDSYNRSAQTAIGNLRA